MTSWVTYARPFANERKWLKKKIKDYKNKYFVEHDEEMDRLLTKPYSECSNEEIRIAMNRVKLIYDQIWNMILQLEGRLISIDSVWNNFKKNIKRA